MVAHSPETRLLAAAQLVNDWLKFAELKNGALLTLNGMAVMAVHQMREWYEPQSILMQAWIWCATIGLSLSLLLCLASLYARTNIRAIEFLRTTKATEPNMMFFGDLAQLNKKSVLQAFKVTEESVKEDKYLSDLAAQLVTNAKITDRKFEYFNLSLLITIAGLITPVGALLFYWLLCDDTL